MDVVLGKGRMLNEFPEVMTADEAVRYLRLDLTGVKNPLDTLKYYREKGLLKGVRLGRSLRYTRANLDAFLAEQAERN